MAPVQPDRRRLVRAAAAWPLASLAALAVPRVARAAPARSRVRPGDPRWPSAEAWSALRRQVGDDALLAVRSPFDACIAKASAPDCDALWKRLKNPYALGDDVALTQTLGWVDAWTSRPSAYAVAARDARAVAAAVSFAREHDLRLVVKGGGHSYQGTSNAADSLLVWTRRMDGVVLHDAFVAAGCSGRVAPTRAVSVGAGAIWSHVYDAVTTEAGGYVQGGGCMTVGVAGLIQSGGFGSFSKRYGMAAASLLEAEVVTADGAVRIANPCTNPELFWGLKGGGGGSLGVVTRGTLRVPALPERFGAVNMTVRATSDAAYRRLIGIALDFYRKSLANPHWGEQLRLRPDNALGVAMVFQGMTRSEAQDVWRPFFAALDAAPDAFKVDFAPLKIVSTSARDFFAPTLVKRVLGFVATDDRPGAPSSNVFWPGDRHQAGQVLHGYASTWLPESLLRDDRRDALRDALFAASRRWGVSLHINKGLAGAPSEAIAAARDTATNPAVLDAFALAISGAEEQPAYPGVPGHEPDVARARKDAGAVRAAHAELRKLVREPGSYVSESDFFEADWQRAFWGANHARLAALKERVDPDGLFFVHHGVGSERWSADGFTRVG
jgi:FAD/FMN-containing dehydrogenase